MRQFLIKLQRHGPDKIPPEAKQRRSIPSLDGLRGFAVLLVVAAHLGLPARADGLLLKHGLNRLAPLVEVDAGDLGVSIFFVISGFLITTLLTRQEKNEGRISLQTFYLRRFFRIFPPYYVYLFTVGLLWAIHAVPMLKGALISAWLYGSNYYPYRLSQPASAGWLVGHTWSLSLEEQFYLLWPACLIWLGKKRSAWLGVVLILLAPVARLATLHFAPGTAFLWQIERMFHTRIDTIMAGCVLALMDTWPKIQAAVMRSSKLLWTGTPAGILLYVVLHASWRSTTQRLAFGIGLEAVLLAYLLRYAIENAHTWGGGLLNHRWLRHLGVISYSLYLWQQMFDGPTVLLKGHSGLKLVLILVVAELSYFLVEKGSFRIRDYFLTRWKPRAHRPGVAAGR